MRALSVMVGIVVAARLTVAQDPAPKPKFEVAAIRPFVPKPGSAGVAPPLNPDHFNISAALRFLIQRAYGLEDYQIVGPGSLGTVWTIAAKGAPGTEEQAKLMLQSLLEERFHLMFHHEMKEFKAYNLVITKGGLKLKKSIPTDGCSMGATSVEGKACGPRSGGCPRFS